MKHTDAIMRQFANDMREAIRADLLEELSGGSGRARAKSSRASLPMAAHGKGQKRSPEALQKTVDRLHAHIRKNPGQRIEIIASALGVPTKDLNLPVKKLIASKAVTTRGQKRATSYSAK